jgi:hypothetical protein
MLDARWVLAAFLANVFVNGCVADFMARSKPFVARGTWIGSGEPIMLLTNGERSAVTGIRFTVSDGPPLRQDGDPDGTIVNPAGWSAILVDEKVEVVPSDRLAPSGPHLRVSGFWSTQYQRARWHGEEARLLPDNPAPDLYNVLISREIQSVEVGSPSTRAAPATTRATGIELKVKLVPHDRFDLSWTPLTGAALYQIELSSDGVNFDESMEVEADNTTASLVGLEEAQAGQTVYIRVRAVDKNDRVLDTSNVHVLSTPKREPGRQ